MSNDLNFLNTYTEVMHENISVIIKQNFVFQTQLKLAENQIAQLADARKVADNLSIQNRDLQTKVNELSGLTASYKNVADDKSRLQLSLNENSQAKNQLQSELNSLQQEVGRLRLQSDELAELKKKIKSEELLAEELAQAKAIEKPIFIPQMSTLEPKNTKKIEKSTKTAVAGTF